MDKYTLYTEDSVLMVIDIQERMLPVMDHGEQVISKTVSLIKIAEKLEMPIILIEMYPKGLGKTVPEVMEHLAGVPRFEKITFSACCEIPLTEHLKKLGRRKIIVTGMETHVCVLQTVRSLLELGYQVFLVGDAVSSRTKHNYRNALALMHDMGAVITNTETVFFDLMKQSGTPVFKELSAKYIK
ncbi:MAG TPA: hydrolase [Desulfitobacteriaceae bacterium]|nr:hydrolase [Desulfitobacteriaceae bacterium]